MDSLLQLLQLNLKTLVTLIKISLTAVVVSLWTGNNISLQELFSIRNVSFGWDFVKIYLLFYFIISATFGFIGLKLSKLFLKKFSTQSEQKEYAELVFTTSEKVLKKIELNHRAVLSKLISYSKPIIGYSYDISIIFIQLAIVFSNFWFILPTAFLVIAIPMYSLGIQMVILNFNNEHN